MHLERRLLSYIAMLIATIYYFFGRADAVTVQPEPVSMQSAPTALVAALHH